MVYDIVIPLKAQCDNEDLRFTLRSIDGFARNIGQIWIVGYLPEWVHGVRYVPTKQTGTKWSNTLLNRRIVCRQDELSDDFLLFNDDFILTEEVHDWDTFTNINCGTLLEKAEALKQAGHERSVWERGFRYTNDILLQFFHVNGAVNMEFHGPMIINKRGFARTYEDERIRSLDNQIHPCLLNRSLHANLYPRLNAEKARRVQDCKIRGDLLSEKVILENGWFSVADGMIGHPERFPKLNAWLLSQFPKKSRWEK